MSEDSRPDDGFGVLDRDRKLDGFRLEPLTIVEIFRLVTLVHRHPVSIAAIGASRG